MAVYFVLIVGILLWIYGGIRFNKAKKAEDDQGIRKMGATAFVGMGMTTVAICGLIIPFLGEAGLWVVLAVLFIMISVAVAIYIKPGFMKDV